MCGVKALELIYLYLPVVYKDPASAHALDA